MDVKYINPFLSSIRNVFDTMLQVPFRMGKPHLKQDPLPYHEVSSVIGLSGSITGSVVVNLSKGVAMKLASALSGEEISEIDEDCIDAVGEIANMVVGGAKKDFPGGNNSISVPSVIIGRHQVRYPRGVPIISIPCETDAGQLAIDVALKGITEPAAAKANV